MASGKVKIGHIRALRDHCNAVLDAFDASKVAAGDIDLVNAERAGRKPEGGAPNPAGADAAPTIPMHEAFPVMKNRWRQ